MRILVDAMPTDPEECLFMEYVEVVHQDALEEAEVCDDCGGVILDDEDINIVCGCSLTGIPCAFERGEECECLALGYVTRF